MKNPLNPELKMRIITKEETIFKDNIVATFTSHHWHCDSTGFEFQTETQLRESLENAKTAIKQIQNQAA